MTISNHQKYWVIDTETTGLNVKEHRIIEIAGTEIINRQITGRYFHFYLNPDRDIDPRSYEIHGIDLAFLQDKPRFFEVGQEILDLIKNYHLIMHNAHFDLTFLATEYERMGIQFSQSNHYGKVIDTLDISRKKHIHNLKHSLDALCIQYDIDSSERKYHGALIDTKLLAQVYLAMTV